MAISQPAADDGLNSPDHSLMHRQIATDPSAPVESLTIDSAGDMGGTCFKSVNPTNLLSNGDFESWSAGTSSAPDGWTFSGNTIAREDTIIKLGTYSVKLTYTDVLTYIYKEIHTEKGIAYWKGRTVTLSCWVWCDTADEAKIRISDGDTATAYSDYHTGGSTWELITTTVTVGSSATRLRAGLFIDGAADAYFDGAMLVEGASAFAFSPKPASYEEGVWTPVYGGSSGSIGATAYSIQLGAYTKIGNVVHAQGAITLTNNGDWTGNVFILGLPFLSKTMPSATMQAGGGSVYMKSVTFDGYATPYIASNISGMQFWVTKTAAALVKVICSNVSDTGTFNFTITYLAA